MGYLNKVLTMKQVSEGFSLSGKPIAGIARLEIESGVATFYLSLINIATVNNGSYVLLLQDSQSKVYSFDIGKRPTSFSTVLPDLPNLEKGFCAGLSYICDDLPILVAFACSDTIKVSVSDFRKILADKCLSDRKITQKNQEFADEISKKITEEIINKPANYDDEVVATENYYVNDSDIQEKLKIIEEMENKNVQDETCVPPIQCQEEKGKEENSFFSIQNEADDDSSQNYTEQNPYYYTVRKELEDIFLKFAPEETLERTIPESRWAKINYSEGKFYVVGLVIENKKEKYICYGVPSRYSPDPPKELAGYCSFIPLSVFDMKGDGYWIMFQDAVTGQCIHLNNDL